jgi:hypothetical protein
MRLEKSKMKLSIKSKGEWGDGMGKTERYRRTNQYNFNCKTYNS